MKIYYSDNKNKDTSLFGFPVVSKFDESSDTCHAYWDISANKYFIKYNNAKLYNPNPMYEVDNKKRPFHDLKWKWIEVSVKTFTLYINFLKTEQEKFLIQAERELL